MITNQDFKDLGDVGFKKISSLKYIFKYVNLRDGIDHILKENTFKFNDPLEFNDPFDCNELLVNISVDPQAERKIILEEGKRHNIPKNLIEQFLKKTGNPKVYQDVLNQKKKDFRVSCFSEISSEVLMWSHYADKHKGICIKFQFNPINEDYVFYPVNYISEVQHIDGMVNAPFVFYYLVSVKANCWSYEKEIRAVSKNREALNSYPKHWVKEVIFGCNLKSSEIDLAVKEIEKMNYANIIYSKMEIDPKTLGLKKISLN